MPTSHPLPIAIIGAGPIGLTAALHLLSRGERPVVFEAGDRVGASIRDWGHVRLFSPWKYLVDPLARQTLAAVGWVMPDPEHLPTGSALVASLLDPLASLPQLAAVLRTGHRVIAVTRYGLDKVKTEGRDRAPFELAVRTVAGTSRFLARAVIDASGTWRSPNPLGAGGVAAVGEPEASDRIAYRIPDARGADRAVHAGRHTLVVGSGHSAFNALLDLVALAGEVPGTQLTWAVRRSAPGLMFGGGADDALAERGALGGRVRQAVEDGAVRLVLGFRTTAVAPVPGGVRVESDGGQSAIGPVDRIVATTGFRPDLSLTRELRLGLDPWLEAPVALAPLIDPNVHSCGTVMPHGAAELAHPEPDFFTVGMKSYGRAPTFLLLTGYEQVRSVVCRLTGDEEGARSVQLVLPDTGVCQTDLGGSTCCGTPAEQALLPLTATPRP